MNPPPRQKITNEFAIGEEVITDEGVGTIRDIMYWPKQGYAYHITLNDGFFSKQICRLENKLRGYIS